MTTTAPGVDPIWSGDIGEQVVLYADYLALRSQLTAAGERGVRVGPFTIQECKDPLYVLVAHSSGESGSFKLEKLVARLDEFWKEEF